MSTKTACTVNALFSPLSPSPSLCLLLVFAPVSMFVLRRYLCVTGNLNLLQIDRLTEGRRKRWQSLPLIAAVNIYNTPTHTHTLMLTCRSTIYTNNITSIAIIDYTLIVCTRQLSGLFECHGK